MAEFSILLIFLGVTGLTYGLLSLRYPGSIPADDRPRNHAPHS